jgi:hypothetical protein
MNVCFCPKGGTAVSDPDSKSAPNGATVNGRVFLSHRRSSRLPGSKANAFEDERHPPQTSKSNPSLERERLRGVFTTLKQACPSEYQGAQDAFKDSMIH